MNWFELRMAGVLPDDIDPECAALCRAINCFAPALYTTGSCCGHGDKSYRIWFRVGVGGIDCLPGLLYWFDSCHCGLDGWQVTVGTDCAMSPPTFKIQGPTGVRAYEEANRIAALIVAYLSEQESGE